MPDAGAPVARSGRARVVLCRNFAREAHALRCGPDADAWTDVAFCFMDANCGRPPVSADVVRSLAGDSAPGERVHVIGSACVAELARHTSTRSTDKTVGLEPRPSTAPPFPQSIVAHRNAACFDLVAPPTLTAHLSASGAYLLTPGWLERWRDNMTAMGLDRETAHDLFGASANRLVLLDTQVDPESPALLRELADHVGLPFETLPIGLDYMRLYLRRLIEPRRHDAPPKTSSSPAMSCSDDRAKAAEYAMALDLLRLLRPARTEDEVAAQIIDIVAMLFAPDEIVYLGMADGEPGVIRSSLGPMPPADAAAATTRLMGVTGDAEWTADGMGFRLRLADAGQCAGILEVNRVAIVEAVDRYLNLGLAIAPVFALAIAGVRAFEQSESARKDLHERNTELDSLFELSTDLLCVLSATGIVEQANPAWRDLMGYDPQALVGQPVRSLLHPDDADAAYHSVTALRSEGAVYNLRARTRRSDGAFRWVDWRGRTIGANRFYVAGRDVTDAIEAERLLRESHSDLERAVLDRTRELEEWVRELDAFAYTVAHNLRSPLRGIDGFCAVASYEHADEMSPALAELCERVRSNSKRMGALIDDLLEYSRATRRPMELTQVDVHAAVESCWGELEPQRASRTLRLSIGDLPPCWGDRAFVHEIMRQVLSNAVKFTRMRGEAEITVGASRDGTDIVYTVRDNGIGFPKDQADKVFGVFEHLHRQEDYEGSGMGLAIALRLAGRMGGGVRAEGEEGIGAAFHIILPSCDPTSNEREDTEP